MPIEYKRKQEAMREEVLNQYDLPPMTGPIRLEVDVKGEGRGDADNIIGALLDTCNGVLWVDDRVSVIPEIQIRWQKAPKNESQWIVRIYLID